jgi:iron-sulfur cluster insertion protein
MISSRIDTEKTLYTLQAEQVDCTKNLFATQTALEHLKSLHAAETKTQDTDVRFRIRVDSGGCSGFQYHFNFDTCQNEDDVIFHGPELEFIIDSLSLDLLDGVILDYIEDLIGAAFRLKNPNATAGCGCGNSFSV